MLMSLFNKPIMDWINYANLRQRLLITQGRAYLRKYMRVKNSRIAVLREIERTISDCVRVKDWLNMTDGEIRRDLFAEIDRLIQRENDYHERRRTSDEGNGRQEHAC